MTTASSPTDSRHGAAAALSLLLCSRNDAYMGNSRWRLTTVLDYTAARVAALQRSADVEVLVADWGSREPLHETLVLSEAARDITSFVWIPPDVAAPRQRDSPFPEVLALNAAARRARGRFLGRIDQDTLVGGRFLRTFFAWVGGAWPLPTPMDETLLFANRRSVPYRLAVRHPSLWCLERYVDGMGRRLRVETCRPGKEFYGSDVGIWLLHRSLWHACGGYDERLIYMNEMEIDMAVRLMTRYPMVDLGQLVSYDFYHLDHYHPRGPRKSATHRRVNQWAFKGWRTAPRVMAANGADWGLGGTDLPRHRTRRAAAPVRRPAGILARPLTATVIALVACRQAADHIAYRVIARWRNRGRLGWAAIRHEPLGRWPSILRHLWQQRESVRSRGTTT